MVPYCKEEAILPFSYCQTLIWPCHTATAGRAVAHFIKRCSPVIPDYSLIIPDYFLIIPKLRSLVHLLPYFPLCSFICGINNK